MAGPVFALAVLVATTGGDTAASTDGLKTVAVVALGDERAAAAASDALAAPLSALPGHVVVPLESFAQRLGGAAPEPGMSADDAAALARRFDTVSDLYGRDRITDALDELARIGKLLESAPFVPVRERVREQLWRATINLADGEKANAASAIRTAVGLQPDLVVDQAQFPPSVQRLVEEQKGSGLRLVTLSVTGLPPGAVARIDGRDFQGSVEVARGDHWLTAHAPGYAWIERRVNVQADTTLELRLPLQLAEPRRTALLAAVGRDAGASLQPAFLDAMQAIGTDAVVVVVGEPGEGPGRASAAIWTRARPKKLEQVPSGSLDGTGRDAFTAAVAEAIRGYGKRGGLWAFAVRAGGVLPFRANRLFAENGATGYEMARAGAGPRAGATMFYRGRWYASVEFEWHLYGFGALRAEYPDGDEARVGNGQSFFTRASLGGRMLLKGTSFDRGYWWGWALGYESESFIARDLERDGDRLGLQPSHYRRVVLLELNGGMPVGSRLAAGARVAIAPGTEFTATKRAARTVPWNRWREHPEGTTGEDPVQTTSPTAGLFAVWRDGRAYDLRAEWTITATTVSFVGDSRLPVDPRITGARRQEILQTFGITAGWEF